MHCHIKQKWKLQNTQNNGNKMMMMMMSETIFSTEAHSITPLQNFFPTKLILLKRGMDNKKTDQQKYSFQNGIHAKNSRLYRMA
jgi:hypothetical protein